MDEVSYDQEGVSNCNLNRTTICRGEIVLNFISQGAHLVESLPIGLNAKGLKSFFDLVNVHSFLADSGKNHRPGWPLLWFNFRFNQHVVTVVRGEKAQFLLVREQDARVEIADRREQPCILG